LSAAPIAATACCSAPIITSTACHRLGALAGIIVDHRHVDFAETGGRAASQIATFAPHCALHAGGVATPMHLAGCTPPHGSSRRTQRPKWLAARRRFPKSDVAMIDNDFRKRAQSVQAVDVMIGALQQAVAAIGAADNTYFAHPGDRESALVPVIWPFLPHDTGAALVLETTAVSACVSTRAEKRRPLWLRTWRRWLGGGRRYGGCTVGKGSTQGPHQGGASPTRTAGARQGATAARLWPA